MLNLLSLISQTAMTDTVSRKNRKTTVMYVGTSLTISRTKFNGDLAGTPSVWSITFDPPFFSGNDRVFVQSNISLQDAINRYAAEMFKGDSSNKFLEEWMN